MTNSESYSTGNADIDREVVDPLFDAYVCGSVDQAAVLAIADRLPEIVDANRDPGIQRLLWNMQQALYEIAQAHPLDMAKHVSTRADFSLRNVHTPSGLGAWSRLFAVSMAITEAIDLVELKWKVAEAIVSSPEDTAPLPPVKLAMLALKTAQDLHRKGQEFDQDGLETWLISLDASTNQEAVDVKASIEEFLLLVRAYATINAAEQAVQSGDGFGSDRLVELLSLQSRLSGRNHADVPALLQRIDAVKTGNRQLKDEEKS